MYDSDIKNLASLGHNGMFVVNNRIIAKGVLDIVLKRRRLVETQALTMFKDGEECAIKHMRFAPAGKAADVTVSAFDAAAGRIL